MRYHTSSTGALRRAAVTTAAAAATAAPPQPRRHSRRHSLLPPHSRCRGRKVRDDHPASEPPRGRWHLDAADERALVHGALACGEVGAEEATYFRQGVLHAGALKKARQVARAYCAGRRVTHRREGGLDQLQCPVGIRFDRGHFVVRGVVSLAVDNVLPRGVAIVALKCGAGLQGHGVAGGVIEWPMARGC